MKSLSIIFYVVGSILLIVSCFTSGVTVTWILGGLSVLFLTAGCVFQYCVNKNNVRTPKHHYPQSH